MKRLMLLLLWLGALLALPVGAHAQDFPALSGRVVDAANLLSPEQEAQLTQLSAEIEKASSRQFVVATIPDLQGYDIADYGYQLGRHWKIGQSEANNGILLIVAPNERKVRIEVGYGLEPVMTDALSNQIIQETILPRFRDGDMAGGIVAGASAIGEQMKLPLEAAEARAKQLTEQRERSGGGEDNGWVGGLILLFWVVVFLSIVVPMIFGRKRRGKRYRGRGGGSGVANIILWTALDAAMRSGSSGGGSSWGGGGSSWGGGGGGFSGGGGSFGGGGASGGW